MRFCFCFALVATVTAVDTNTSNAAGLCTNDGRTVTCKHHTAKIKGRNVYYQVPSGTTPNGGWPSVIIFHGWNLYAENSWNAKSSDAYGVHNKALLVMNLLNAGYAVVTPNADKSLGYWYTNDSPYASDRASDITKWNASSPDHAYLLQIFSQMPSWGMNVGNFHCAGFSSGGYMASRMAVNYDVCKSISINSGAYYYCDGPSCPQPGAFYEPYLKSQVPTLFLQGTSDNIVPPSTQKQYYDKLKSLGVTTNRILEQGVGHQWIDSAATDILNWIKKHDANAQSTTIVV